MNPTELAALAARARSMREFLTALLLASGVLGLFFLIPNAHPLPAESAGAAPAPDAFAAVPIEAKAAIVYDLAQGTVLYEKNASAQLPLASLTKLLTVYAALSTLSPHAEITIPAEAARVDAPRALTAGETFALDDLARITLTASLNDGAVAIAQAAGDAQDRPAAAPAAAAAGLSLAQTYAVNGSGLDENAATSGGYGSARDIALLAGALVREAPEVAAATTEHSAQAISQSGRQVAVANTDPFVGTIPRLLLSKTGYTDLAGGNLALVFDAGIGHPIAVVVLGSSKEARFTDGAALVAATLAHFSGVASLSP